MHDHANDNDDDNHSSSSSNSSSTDDAFDSWMNRGQQLRKLRQLAAADEAARRESAETVAKTQQQQHESCDRYAENEWESVPFEEEEDTNAPSKSHRRRMLLYESFLANQYSYDDLKHCDYDFLAFGRRHYNNETKSKKTETTNATHDDETEKEHKNESLSLIIEQDKSLGKGGLCWDAAYILAEYLVAHQQEWLLLPTTNDDTGSDNIETKNNTLSIVELGSGTGLAGLLLAHWLNQDTSSFQQRCVQILLTDLPPIRPLLERNVRRNGIPVVGMTANTKNAEEYDDDARDDIQWYRLQNDDRIHQNRDSPTLATAAASDDDGTNGIDDDDDDDRGGVQVACDVLDWADVVAAPADSNSWNAKDTTLANNKKVFPTFSIILGADIVASLYDPVALARTMHRLAKNNDDDVASASRNTTKIFLSFKERLSTIHRTFEAELGRLFEHVQIVDLSGNDDRIRHGNPNVRILVASGRRGV